MDGPPAHWSSSAWPHSPPACRARGSIPRRAPRSVPPMPVPGPLERWPASPGLCRAVAPEVAAVFAMVLESSLPADRVRLVPLPAQAFSATPSSGLLGCRPPLRHCLPCVCPGCPASRAGGPGACWTWRAPAVVAGFSPSAMPWAWWRAEPCLQASSLACHSVPGAVSPWGAGGRFRPCSAGSHRLTSPQIRTVRACSPVRTRRQSAPLRGGYGPRVRPSPPSSRAAFAFAVRSSPRLRPPS